VARVTAELAKMKIRVAAERAAKVSGQDCAIVLWPLSGRALCSTWHDTPVDTSSVAVEL
jgi:hypothetical protein